MLTIRRTCVVDSVLQYPVYTNHDTEFAMVKCRGPLQPHRLPQCYNGGEQAPLELISRITAP